MPKPYQLGVLFVHGIGKQQPGQTLVAYADSLHAALRRLLTEDDRPVREHGQALAEVSKRQQRSATEEERAALVKKLKALQSQIPDFADPVRLSDTRLRPGAAESEAPAHLILTMDSYQAVDHESSVPDRDQESSVPDSSAWCLAESWWAEEFAPPNFKTLAVWGLTVVPEVLEAHFTKVLRRAFVFNPGDWRRWWRLLAAPPLVLFVLCAHVALILLLAVLLLLYALPIPRVSQLVGKLGARLAASVGDSYVLLESPTSFDAMRSRVGRDLRWLGGRCEQVAVVAHSQGAVLVHLCLKRDLPEEVRLLVTVGSGLGKLYDTRWSSMSGSTRGRTGFVALTLVAAVAAPVVGLRFGVGLVALLLAYVGLLFGGSLYGRLRQSGIEDVRRLRDLQLAQPPPGPERLRWADFHASADPVSNGPLVTGECQWLHRSETVWNGSSWLTDHSSYTRNTDGFVLPLVQELAQVECGALHSFLTARADALERARKRRAWRAHQLVGARVLMLVTAVPLLVGEWRGLLSMARELLAAVPAPLQAVGRAVGKLLGGATDFLAPMLRVDPAVVLALALGALAVLAAWLLLEAALRLWERHDIALTFRGEPLDAGGAAATTFYIVALVLPLVLVGLSLGLFRSDGWWALGFVSFNVFYLIALAHLTHRDVQDEHERKDQREKLWVRLLLPAAGLQVVGCTMFALPMLWLLLSGPIASASAFVGWLILRRPAHAARQWLIRRSVAEGTPATT